MKCGTEEPNSRFRAARTGSKVSEGNNGIYLEAIRYCREQFQVHEPHKVEGIRDLAICGQGQYMKRILNTPDSWNEADRGGV